MRLGGPQRRSGRYGDVRYLLFLQRFELQILVSLPSRNISCYPGSVCEVYAILVYVCDGLRSWEMAFNVGVDTPFDNMSNWKPMWEQAGEVNNTKPYITSG
jgi:hypothetical protein